MKILLNYADGGKFLQSQLLNSQSGLAAGFNTVYHMNRNEIDAEFLKKNEEILSEKRGVGYWLWKPYFINKILQTMEESDILFYADAGSVFVRRMEPVFEAVISDPKGVVAFKLAGGHIEKRYTKRDVFKHMNLDHVDYTDTPQRMASFMCFRGTEYAKSIAKDYLDLCCDPHLLTDTPNKDGWIEQDFVEHRHDQSIWSLLTKKHNVTILSDPTQWGVQQAENSQEEQYIIHTRDPR